MTKYENFIRTTAKADLVLFTLLALPYVSVFILGLIFDLGVTLGDTRAIPDLSGPFVQLTINLVGVFGLFTVWVRFQKPSPKLGQAIGILKLCASFFFGLAIIMGEPLVLGLFLTIDLITSLQLMFHRVAS